MKKALVCDWLETYAGAERCVQSFTDIWDDFEVFSLVDYLKFDDRQKILNGKFARTSFIQNLPFAKSKFRSYLPLFPLAIERFDLSEFDLVLSSSHAVAKGVLTHSRQLHVSYVHTPMRYAWDLFFDYRKRSGRLTRFFMDKWMHEIREWDYISSQRIDTLIANSKYISRRIKKFWNLDAEVIYSPVNLKRFTPIKNPSLDYYVAFSRLVPYKRIDIALDACKALGKNLVVIGSGSEEKSLKKRAAGAKNITFTGRISDEKLCAYLQNCKALIFCAEEDFGLVPLEAQACGRPVIAYGKGGACETVEDGETGVFFSEQTADSAKEAIERFEALDKKGTFKSETIAQHAASFSEERFIREFQTAVERARKASE